MMNKEKEAIVNEIIELLEKLTDDKAAEPSKSPPAEMLTIRECTGAVQGVSEHTIRQLVAQDKVKHIRTGEGKRGKILVNKADLLAYFGA
ncbi:MAG: DNA-binding protein [Ruminococcus sp.]|nr:DNA-binding protein [Ruminococcus sp.]